MGELMASIKKNKKLILKRIALFLMIRLQMFCATAGTLIWIIHFDLIDSEFGMLFIALGMISVPLVMLSLIPLPTDIEREFIERTIKEDAENV